MCRSPPHAEIRCDVVGTFGRGRAPWYFTMMEHSGTFTIAAHPLIETRVLRKWYPVRGSLCSRVRGHVRAVDDVSLGIRRGEVLGLVGESGCGKSTLGRLMLRLLQPTSGRVLFDGLDVEQIVAQDVLGFRRRAQIVFQDPYSSLNPRLTVGSMLREVLHVHGIAPRQDIPERIAILLRMVGLNDFHARRYPHEFSGGQRQRIGIARALAVDPVFLVCDEPVSALDVSIQAQILNLLTELQQQLTLTYLFISHDLSVVQHVSHRIAIMYLGRIVELGEVDRVMNHPLHPYTRMLLDAAPVADPRAVRKKPPIVQDMLHPLDLPAGCSFRPRCSSARPECATYAPSLVSLHDAHAVSCFLHSEPGTTSPTPASAGADAP
mgnify:CR=1 FL=1